MARWVRAAEAAADGRPVLVVTGGFHRPALGGLVEAGRAEGAGAGEDGWPEVPAPPPGAIGGSFLVPYSFRQLDAFAGYQSGMPSPAYYQRLWEAGQAAAGDDLVRAVVERLRARNHPVSTAALIAARSTALGLAALRGQPRPTRLDLLDGLAGALITDALDEPLPWTRRGPLSAGAHPVVVEMVAACSGDRVGRLHPDTPAPPLVHDVAARLAALGLDTGKDVSLRLTDAGDLARSQVLHRLRVLGIPGFERVSGPAHGTDPVFAERWEIRPGHGREAALIEAGGFGASLEEAAAVALGDLARACGSAAGAGADRGGPQAGGPPGGGPQAGGPPGGALARVLFDAVMCGATRLSALVLAELRAGLDRATAPGPLGEVLRTALGLWRHDRVYGVARDPLLAAAMDTAVGRILWLVEGVRGSGAPDHGRLRALAATRDALLHAEELLTVSRPSAAAVCRRISVDPAAPADLRGAAFGLSRVLAPSDGLADDGRTYGGPPVSPRMDAGPADGSHGPSAGPSTTAGAAARAIGDPGELGDWLAGLFALAREELTARGGGEPLIDVLDASVRAMTETEFLIGLPALRQAFAYFPPREREQIAARLIERRGLRGSARALLRTTADPLLIARAQELESHVRHTLDTYGLRATS